MLSNTQKTNSDQKPVFFTERKQQTCDESNAFETGEFRADQWSSPRSYRHNNPIQLDSD